MTNVLVYLMFGFFLFSCGSNQQNQSSLKDLSSRKYFVFFSGYSSCPWTLEKPLDHSLITPHLTKLIAFLKVQEENIGFSFTCFDGIGGLYYSHGSINYGAVTVNDGGFIGFQLSTIADPDSVYTQMLFKPILKKLGEQNIDSLYIGGYSWGGWMSLRFAYHAAKADLEVPLLLTIDPVSKIYCSVQTILPAYLLPIHFCKSFPHDIVTDQVLSPLANGVKTWLNYYQSTQRNIHSSKVMPNNFFNQYQGQIEFDDNYRHKTDIATDANPKIFNLELKGKMLINHDLKIIQHNEIIYNDEIWQTLGKKVTQNKIPY